MRRMIFIIIVGRPGDRFKTGQQLINLLNHCNSVTIEKTLLVYVVMIVVSDPSVGYLVVTLSHDTESQLLPGGARQGSLCLPNINCS